MEKMFKARKMIYGVLFLLSAVFLFITPLVLDTEFGHINITMSNIFTGRFGYLFIWLVPVLFGVVMTFLSMMRIIKSAVIDIILFGVQALLVFAWLPLGFAVMQTMPAGTRYILGVGAILSGIAAILGIVCSVWALIYSNRSQNQSQTQSQTKKQGA